MWFIYIYAYVTGQMCNLNFKTDDSKYSLDAYVNNCNFEAQFMNAFRLSLSKTIACKIIRCSILFMKHINHSFKKEKSIISTSTLNSNVFQYLI